MQLFSADATIFLKGIEDFFCPPKHIKTALKIAHNPTRPRVFSPVSICLCGTETVL